MRVEISVSSTVKNRVYEAAFLTRDPQQVWNEICRGRKAAGLPHITKVHLEGDKQAFRVGGEKDTVTWLSQRFEQFEAKTAAPAGLKGGKAEGGARARAKRE
jgi:hypothetical protein